MIHFNIVIKTLSFQEFEKLARIGNVRRLSQGKETNIMHFKNDRLRRNKIFILMTLEIKKKICKY